MGKIQRLLVGALGASVLPIVPIVVGAVAVPVRAQGSARPPGCAFVAHRGYWQDGRATEDGMPAYRHASAHGASIIETDLRSIRGGNIVLMHDSTLDRTTTSRGRVQDLTFRQAQAVRLDDGSRLPFLKRFLRYVRGHGLHAWVEIKRFSSARSYRRLARRVRQYGLTRRVHISSFHPDALRHIATYLPRVSRSLIRKNRPTVRAIRAAGADGVHIRYSRITGTWMAHMARAGLTVYPWTVDDQPAWPDLTRYRAVDAIVTDLVPEFADYEAAGCPEPTG